MTKDDIIREEVLMAAMGLFKRYGMHKTTMEDIARAAGKGKSTLYYYFRNKEQIFDEILEDEFKQIFDRVKQAVEAAHTAKEKIKTFTLEKLKAIHEKSILYDILFGEMREDMNFMNRCKKRFAAQQTELLVQILANGIAANELREITEVSLEDMAYLVNSAHWGIEAALIESSDIGEMIGKFEAVLEVLLYGLVKS